MKKRKIATIINILIIVFVTIGLICMLLNIKFMSKQTLLTANKIENFKFFTVDSNILMGLSALLYVIYNNKVIKKEQKEIPKKVGQIKLIATTAIMLTFLVTAFFLVPTSIYPAWMFYQNSNLFFHLVVPLLSLYSFLFLEKDYHLPWKNTFLGILPIIIYSIFYTGNIIIHTQNRQVSWKYDFYGFLRGGYQTMVFVIPLMLIITYAISYTLWFFNKKIERSK